MLVGCRESVDMLEILNDFTHLNMQLCTYVLISSYIVSLPIKVLFESRTLHSIAL